VRRIDELSQTNRQTKAKMIGLAAARTSILSFCCVVLSACLTTKAPPPPPDPCRTDPNGIECLCRNNSDSVLQRCISACESNRNSRECACLVDPGSERCVNPCAFDPNLPECCPNDPARYTVIEAIVRLDQGDWDEGRRLVQCALNRQPGNRRAKSLQRQLQLTPIEYFGTTQSTQYMVAPNDTLAKIAQRCLNDADKFVVLARLNNISRPSDLVVGQRIRIPGTRPCLDADEALTEALSREEKGDLAGAYEALQPAASLSSTPEINEAFDRISRSYIRELHKEAAALSKDGDCSAAKAIWEKILRIDKTNALAQDSLKYAPC
jgi:LysM repeat protein